MLRPVLSFPQYPAYESLSPYTIRGTNLPHSQQDYLINCDWVTFSATQLRPLEDGIRFVTTLKKSERKSFHFSKCFDLFHIDQPTDEIIPFAYVDAEAHVSYIDKNIVTVKLQNKYLYTKDLPYWINLICSELDLKFKHIGRIDIALDFQKFNLQKELSIEDFMTGVASRTIILKGSKTINNTAEQDEVGNIIYRGRRVRQISFGTRKSSAYFVMYNKSLEMRQKKLKPHIQQVWEAAQFDKEKDTFRIEFSLRLKHDFVNHDTGETFSKKDVSILEKTNLNRLFKCYYKKHFVFAKNDNKRFDRCTPVDCFDLQADDFLQCPLSDKKESHVHIKAQVNRIVKRLVNMTFQDRENLSGLDYYLSEMVHIYHLYNWFHKKFPDFRLKFIQETEGLLGSQLSLNFN